MAAISNADGVYVPSIRHGVWNGGEVSSAATTAVLLAMATVARFRRQPRDRS
jgi:hypothetical protein